MLPCRAKFWYKVFAWGKLRLFEWASYSYTHFQELVNALMFHDEAALHTQPLTSQFVDIGP